MVENLESFSLRPDDEPLLVKMVGVGSAGCNMLERSPVPAVALSSSEADLERTEAREKVLISPKRIVDLAQTDPKIVRQMPSVVVGELGLPTKGIDVMFLTTGLGGLTGSVGTAVASSFARANGCLTIALVAYPFSAESERRRKLADMYARRILADIDLMIEFPNDALSQLSPNLSLSKAFGLLNGIMHRPVIDLVAVAGRKDIKPLRNTISSAVRGRFGLGLARGDDRVQRTVAEAFSSPWFDFDASSADAVIAVYSAADPWQKEFEEMMGALRERTGRARIMAGSYADPTLGDKVRLSVILCRAPDG